jgi:hypothetical protein
MEKIEEIKLNGYSNPAEKTESEELDQLFTALSKAQLEMETASEDSTNPFFKSKYADLKSVVSSSRPHLAAHGLCIIQRTMPDENGQVYLYTRLGHTSGQWMESKMAIKPAKSDIQGIGSYITYLRRYMYSSMVGVVTGIEDDDGEKAMTRTSKPLNEKQIAEIESLISSIENFDRKKFYQWCQVKDIKDLKTDKYEGIINSLKAKIRSNGNGK